MQIMAKFEHITEQQWVEDMHNEGYDLEDEVLISHLYQGLPRRATKGSAGYDFLSPFDFVLQPGETVKIPTGVRVKMPIDWVLQIFPRSGLGFKYRLKLNNTVGIIDSDYYFSDNEGHIWIKLTNEGDKVVEVKEGQGFAQGIFLPYGTTVDDNVEEVRNGGFGSTTK